jgi:hypothetical protein
VNRKIEKIEREERGELASVEAGSGEEVGGSSEDIP